MSTRARWIAFAVALLMVLGAVALSLFDSNLTMVPNLEGDEIHPSQTPDLDRATR